MGILEGCERSADGMTHFEMEYYISETDNTSIWTF